jgi:hypothetical protein
MSREVLAIFRRAARAPLVTEEVPPFNEPEIDGGMEHGPQEHIVPDSKLQEPDLGNPLANARAQQVVGSMITAFCCNSPTVADHQEFGHTTSTCFGSSAEFVGEFPREKSVRRGQGLRFPARPARSALSGPAPRQEAMRPAPPCGKDGFA